MALKGECRRAECAGVAVSVAMNSAAVLYLMDPARLSRVYGALALVPPEKPDTVSFGLSVSSMG